MKTILCFFASLALTVGSAPAQLMSGAVTVTGAVTSVLSSGSLNVSRAIIYNSAPTLIVSPAPTPDPNPSVSVGLGTVSLWWTPAAPAGSLIVGTTGSTAVQTGSNVGILDLSVLTANPIAINPGSFAHVSGTLAGLSIGNGNGAFAVGGLMFGQIGQTLSSSVLLGEASVPEPGSGALLVLSALAFFGKRRNTVQF